MMAYREASTRVEEPPQDDNPPEAAFAVRYRSWPALGAAGVLGGVAATLTTVCALNSSVVLGLVGMLPPTILFGFAAHLVLQNAAEVDLRVRPRPDRRGGVRVFLRRRWGFLPWAAPLVFDAPKPPSIMTHWAEGRYSPKNGPSKPYQHACLVLKSGAGSIRLPSMRGATVTEGGGRRGETRISKDHAPEVIAARDLYAAGSECVRRELRRKHSNKDEHVIEDDGGQALPHLIESTENATGLAVVLGIATALLIPGLFALLAFMGVVPRLALAVIPSFAGLLAISTTAMTHGRTLHFRKTYGDASQSIVRVPDYYGFGPLLARTMSESPHVLTKGFKFRVDRVVSPGEDETVSYSLIVIDSARALASSAHEEEMRRYGKRLGGIEVASAS